MNTLPGGCICVVSQGGMLGEIPASQGGKVGEAGCQLEVADWQRSGAGCASSPVLAHKLPGVRGNEEQLVCSCP